MSALDKQRAEAIAKTGHLTEDVLQMRWRCACGEPLSLLTHLAGFGFTNAAELDRAVGSIVSGFRIDGACKRCKKPVRDARLQSAELRCWSPSTELDLSVEAKVVGAAARDEPIPLKLDYWTVSRDGLRVPLSRDDAKALVPYAGESILRAGVLALRSGRPREALALLQKAREILPEHPRLLAPLGRAFLSTGELDEGAKHLARAVALDPASEEAHEALAVLHLGKREIPRAMRHVEALDARLPEQRLRTMRLTRLLAAAGEWEAAAVRIERLLERLAERPLPERRTPAIVHALLLEQLDRDRGAARYETLRADALAGNDPALATVCDDRLRLLALDLPRPRKGETDAKAAERIVEALAQRPGVTRARIETLSERPFVRATLSRAGQSNDGDDDQELAVALTSETLDNTLENKLLTWFVALAGTDFDGHVSFLAPSPVGPWVLKYTSLTPDVLLELNAAEMLHSTSVAENADTLVQCAARHLGAKLDYTPASLELCERVLVAHYWRESYGNILIPLALLFGCYSGEVLRRQLKTAQWAPPMPDKVGHPFPLFQLNPDVRVDLVGEIFRIVREGAIGSLTGMLNLAKQGAARPPPAAPAAKPAGSPAAGGKPGKSKR
ncbi:MAG: tetratricopeptide repeat protein [Deltaproteobacteria bacterium]|nr:tetratricopeptide repeat protein [Deltaproteobacteria bacterium]